MGRWARGGGGSGEEGPGARPAVRYPNKGSVPHRVGLAVCRGTGQAEAVPWLGETPGLGCDWGWRGLLQGGHRARGREECGSPQGGHRVQPPSSAPHVTMVWGSEGGGLVPSLSPLPPHPWAQWEVSTAWVHSAVFLVPVALLPLEKATEG